MDELEIYQAPNPKPGPGRSIWFSIDHIDNIKIDVSEPEFFLEKLVEISNGLLTYGMIKEVHNSRVEEHDSPLRYFAINEVFESDYHSCFIISFCIDENKNFDLVFRARDFYLQGIINYLKDARLDSSDFESIHQNTRHYYYFSDATITSIERISSENSHAITTVTSSSYQDLMRNHGLDDDFSWRSIVASFSTLANLARGNSSGLDFTRVIVATAEALRFRTVAEMINQSHQSSYTWADFIEIVTNWNHVTTEAIDYIKKNNNLTQFSARLVIALFAIDFAKNVPNYDDELKGSNYNYSDTKDALGMPKTLEFSLTKDNSNVQYKHGWCNGEQARHVIDINLGKTAPTNFRKIEFFVDNTGDIFSKASWGNDRYGGKSINDLVKDCDLQDFILTGKYNEGDASIRPDTNLELLDIWRRVTGTARMKIYSGISFYWDNKKHEWHLQILTYMYGESWASFNCGATWVDYGNKIRLSR